MMDSQREHRAIAVAVAPSVVGMPLSVVGVVVTPVAPGVAQLMKTLSLALMAVSIALMFAYLTARQFRNVAALWGVGR